jgi:hypothetical protein
MWAAGSFADGSMFTLHVERLSVLLSPNVRSLGVREGLIALPGMTPTELPGFDGS